MADDTTFDPKDFAAFKAAAPAAAPADDKFDPAEFEASKPSMLKSAGHQLYDIGASAVSGVGKGLSHFAGTGGDLRNLASQGTDYLGNKLGLAPETVDRFKQKAGEAYKATLPINPLAAIAAYGPSSGDVQHGIENVTGEFHAPETTAGKYVQSAADTMANPISYIGPGGLLTKAAMAGASGLGGEAGEELTGSPLGRMAGSMLAGPLGARAVKPNVGESQQALLDAGVNMTPGQLAGGHLKALEDRATSVPLIGSVIQNARYRSVEGFNRAVGNQALESIGQQLPARIQAGHEMVGEVQQRLSDAYDRLVPNLHFIPDHQFAQDIADLQNSARLMPASLNRQFNRILADRLHPDRWVQQQLLPPNTANPNNLPALRYPNIWGLQGQQFKDIESELGHLAGRYTSSSDGGQQLLGEHLNNVVRAMRDNIERVNPQHADELASINRGYAIWARMRDAANKRTTSGGVFTPSDLLAAAKKGDKSAGKNVFARGQALTQEFGEHGQNVLPSNLPTSGTSERAAAMALPAIGSYLLHRPEIAVGAGALMAPYTRAGQWLANRYVAPTTGARASYADAGRGMVPLIRAAASANPYAP